MTPPTAVEGLLRELAPQVLGALVRRYGHFDACEDAVQEALLAAALRWSERGVPERPKGWLITVASRRLTDELRSAEARRRREDRIARGEMALDGAAPGAGGSGAVGMAGEDDTLNLLFLCCHPELTPASQLALCLRAVGGLTTAEIARAFLVPETTMAQRISRAKQRIREAGTRFETPPPEEWEARLGVVLHVLYLVFNEGYATTSGPEASRADLTGEAIRLARVVQRLLPGDGEVAGLLALMLLTEARRPARTDGEGNLVPLAEQDRSRWDRGLIEEGVGLVTAALTAAPLGPYQLQAAIAAVHAEAEKAEGTDWREIVGLYDLLEGFDPSPAVTLNRAVAVAMVDGPEAGLAIVAELEDDDRMKDHHRLAAVRAHMHELAGDHTAAEGAYHEAARLTTSLLERRYLDAKAASLAS